MASAIGFSQRFGFVLSGVGNTTDVGLQITTGRELGRLIAAGVYSAGAGNSSSDILGGVQGDGATPYMVLLAAADIGGPGAQATVGQRIGFLLNTNQLASNDIVSYLDAALVAGAIDGPHLTGVLAAGGDAGFQRSTLDTDGHQRTRCAGDEWKGVGQ